MWCFLLGLNDNGEICEIVEVNMFVEKLCFFLIFFVLVVGVILGFGEVFIFVFLVGLILIVMGVGLVSLLFIYLFFLGVVCGDCFGIWRSIN